MICKDKKEAVITVASCSHYISSGLDFGYHFYYYVIHVLCNTISCDVIHASQEECYTITIKGSSFFCFSSKAVAQHLQVGLTSLKKNQRKRKAPTHQG